MWLTGAVCQAVPPDLAECPRKAAEKAVAEEIYVRRFVVSPRKIRTRSQCKTNTKGEMEINFAPHFDGGYITIIILHPRRLQPQQQQQQQQLDGMRRTEPSPMQRK